MSVWTEAELAIEITGYKAALTAFSDGAQEFTIDLGTSKRTVKRANLKDIREHLEYLSSELDSINNTSASRTFAKQGGRG